MHRRQEIRIQEEIIAAPIKSVTLALETYRPTSHVNSVFIVLVNPKGSKGVQGGGTSRRTLQQVRAPSGKMSRTTEPPAPVHCYTNPSFCGQSEYIPEADLPPPPPRFQVDELPPPPSPGQMQPRYGRSNPAFQGSGHPDPAYDPAYDPTFDPAYDRGSRYEYIEDRPSRYEHLPQGRPRCPQQEEEARRGRYGYVALSGDPEEEFREGRHVEPSRGRYARVPLREEDPPALPDRNGLQETSVSPRNNPATQKLHELLSTPRKPRSRSEERALSPRRHWAQMSQGGGTPRRRALTPGGSPTGMYETSSLLDRSQVDPRPRLGPPGRAPSPGPRGTPIGTPRNRNFSPDGLQTSTPNKETPSARRCLPLTEPISGRQVDGRRYIDPPPRYAYLESPESVPMVAGSPRYKVVPVDRKRIDYRSVESAFIARTAVVPPLSPPPSEANTTLASGPEKNDRRNAPLLLVLVGVLTCGLALYLSWTQGRRYYLDSAAGCGACCALAGACRSLRRTWTGLGLAGLSALSCAGLLLLAAKAPRQGTPLHDVTAGALCGVSLLGAALALVALIGPKCSFGRHRRVHSWIPRFSP